MSRYAFADTETTGATTEDRIVELAVVEFDENLVVQRSIHSLIDPQRSISFAAQGIHNITPGMVTDAPTLDEFIAVVLPAQGGFEEGMEIFAHNARFDKRYLAPVFPNPSGWTCTLRLARRYLPKAENHQLQTLVYQYGLQRGKAHGALEDTLMGLDLLRFIVDLSEKSLDELIAEQRSPQWVRVCPFKKYKDQPMRNVDKGYAEWALDNMKDLDPDMEYSLRCIADRKLPPEALVD